MPYFLSDGEKRIGPFDAGTLVQMQIQPETAVLDDTDDHWQPAHACAELKDKLEAAAKDRAEAIRARAAAEEAGETAKSDELSASAAMTSAKAMHWGQPKADRCSKPGYRQHSAILWDIPGGQNWDQACYSMPNTINGHYFAKPDRCNFSGLHMWGEWDVPDSTCGGSSVEANAVVFLLPDIPLELGHVGWGFKNDDGSWTYGSTETSGIPIPPLMDNGMFIETGSKSKMMSAMRTGRRENGKTYYPYQSYKAIKTHTPNPGAGLTAAYMAQKSGYMVVGNNCMDHVVRVLNGYSGIPIVPLPVTGGPIMWIPRNWYGAIAAEDRMIGMEF